MCKCECKVLIIDYDNFLASSCTRLIEPAVRTRGGGKVGSEGMTVTTISGIKQDFQCAGIPAAQKQELMPTKTACGYSNFTTNSLRLTHPTPMLFACSVSVCVFTRMQAFMRKRSSKHCECVPSGDRMCVSVRLLRDTIQHLLQSEGVFGRVTMKTRSTTFSNQRGDILLTTLLHDLILD